MFSLNHFIWLFIVIMLVIIMLFINNKKQLTYNQNLNILIIVLIISELIKIFSNMEDVYGDDNEYLGTYLNATNLPFHLCSIHIFFIFALKFFIKNEQVKNIILCFLAPTMFLGGIFACLIPTVGTSFTIPQVYQYFLYHGYIIYFSLYLTMNKVIKISFKTYINNFEILFSIVLLVLWINSMMSDKGVNFMFLSRPPLDNLPILNLNHGWIIYFIHLLSLTIIFFTLYHLPFILKKDD